ncbi:MAG: hypothetical protein AAFX65_13330 [Cyanobacteria bacterium J06638_7]
MSEPAGGSLAVLVGAAPEARHQGFILKLLFPLADHRGQRPRRGPG